MMGISLGHLVIVGVVVLLFGSRRLPELGGSLGRGLRAFKEGLSGLEPEPGADNKKLESKPPRQETESK